MRRPSVELSPIERSVSVTWKPLSVNCLYSVRFWQLETIQRIQRKLQNFFLNNWLDASLLFPLRTETNSIYRSFCSLETFCHGKSPETKNSSIDSLCTSWWDYKVIKKLRNSDFFLILKIKNFLNIFKIFVETSLKNCGCFPHSHHLARWATGTFSITHTTCFTKTGY